MSNPLGLTKSDANQPLWMKKLEGAAGRKIGSEPRKRSLYLLLDCSHSMDMNDPAKFAAAKRGAIGLCEEADAKGYAIGLITFAQSAVCRRDASPYSRNMENQIRELVTGPYTNMTDAILLASRKLKARSGQRAICLVTDGQPFTEKGDGQEATLQAAVAAQLSGIEILALGTDDADKAFLDRLVTRKELSVRVARQELQRGITSMAKLLP